MIRLNSLSRELTIAIIIVLMITRAVTMAIV